MTQLKAANKNTSVKEDMGVVFGKSNKKVEKKVQKEEPKENEEKEQVENVKDERIRKMEELIERDLKFLEHEEEELHKEMECNQRKREEIESRRNVQEQLLRYLEEICVKKVEALTSEIKSKEHVKDKCSSVKLSQTQEPPRKTYDLSRWRYSQLRDAINTSTDIELLEACRQEFQKRMKMYQDWRKKNGQNNSKQKVR